MTTTERFDPAKEMIARMLKEEVGRSFLDSGGTPIYDDNGCYVGSKDGYGRSFERNGCADFEKQPHAWLDASTFKGKFEPSVTISLYHWLVSRLSYNEEVDMLFHETYVPEVDADGDKGWIDLMEAFPEWYATRLGFEDAKAGLPRLERIIDGIKNMVDHPLDFTDELKRLMEIAEELIEDTTNLIPDVCGTYWMDTPEVLNSYNGECSLSQTIQFMPFSIDKGPLFVLLQVHGGADV